MMAQVPVLSSIPPSCAARHRPAIRSPPRYPQTAEFVRVCGAIL